MPKVQLRDWITIGDKSAVICLMYDNRPNEIEVVYLDYQKRAINDDVYWVKDHREFLNSGASGGYADQYSRLSSFVSILRSKHRTK